MIRTIPTDELVRMSAKHKAQALKNTDAERMTRIGELDHELATLQADRARELDELISRAA